MKKLSDQFPIEKMSHVFGVARSGYYRFLSTHKGKREQEEKMLSKEMDLYSRKIVGHAVKGHMKKEIVVQALEQAILRRGLAQEGLIFHSDQGSQYGSEAVGESLKKNKILGSMSGKGSCYDNAPMESFFNSLKRECLGEELFKDVEAAEKEIFNYIECYYNNKRKHSALGYLSPVKFEEKYENSLC